MTTAPLPLSISVPVPVTDAAENIINALMRVEGTSLTALQAVARMVPSCQPMYERALADFEQRRCELRTRPLTELQAMHAERIKAGESNRIERERRLAEKVTAREASMFFNRPTANADFSYWLMADFWSVEEATALLLGKDPRVVSSKTLAPHHPSNSATALLGVKPVPAEGLIRQFEELRALLLRSRLMNSADRLASKDVIQWAIDTGAIQPPEELTRAICQTPPERAPSCPLPQEHQNAPSSPSDEVRDDTPSANLRPWHEKRWDADRLAEMKAYRDRHNTKATADHFGISAQRVRQLLPREKAKPTTQRPIATSAFDWGR